MRPKFETVVILVAMMFLVAPGFAALAGAQAAAPLVPTAAAPVAGAKPPAGPQEGIKVHGRWTIDVRNPDGTLVSHTEFENALTSSGRAIIGALLTGRTTVGGWGIILGPQAAAIGPCADPYRIPHDPTGCLVTVSGFAPAGDSGRVFRNLSVTPTPNAESFMLSGTATVTTPGGGPYSIATVGTLAHQCLDPVSATACSADTNPWVLDPFTLHTLATPISVVTGQLVQITVVISFS